MDRSLYLNAPGRLALLVGAPNRSRPGTSGLTPSHGERRLAAELKALLPPAATVRHEHSVMDCAAPILHSSARTLQSSGHRGVSRCRSARQNSTQALGCTALTIRGGASPARCAAKVADYFAELPYDLLILRIVVTEEPAHPSSSRDVAAPYYAQSTFDTLDVVP
jgi:hypothetical protein